MKKLLFSALITLLFPLTSMAATILGVQAGGGSWTHAPSGDITASVSGAGNTAADLKDDLNLEDKTEGYTYFVLEHPVPVIPNLKYVDTKLSSAGSGAVSTTFTFNGQDYTAATNLTTSLVLDQTDTILYYEILDNDLVSVDFGLNAKGINGKASVDDGGTPQTASFSATVPLLYLAAEVGLPYGFSIVAEASTLSLGSNQISDTTAKLTYTSDYYFGLEAGVRTINTKVDVDSVKASMNFSGVFAGLYFKF